MVLKPRQVVASSTERFENDVKTYGTETLMVGEKL